MSSLTVHPRDLRPGDSFESLNADLGFEPVTIKSVEKVRRNNHTAYRVSLDGSDYPVIFQPTTRVVIERKEQGA